MKVNVQSDKETKEELGEIKSAARKFLQRQMDSAKSEDTKAVFDQVIGENEDAFQENIVKATYGFFEFIPLYNLNNSGYKGSLASLALKDVHFTDDYAVVTLSPVHALLKILTFIGFLLLVIAYYIGPSLIRYWLDKKTNRDGKSSDN